MSDNHSLSGRGPDFFSISYVQGRPIHLVGRTTDTATMLTRFGFEEVPLDWFYDVQVSRRKHVARLKLPKVTLSLELKDKQHSFIASGTLHILIWSVGFMIMRLTLTDNGMQRPDDDFEGWFKAMHRLEHDLDIWANCKAAPLWMTRIGNTDLCATGGVRRFLDVVGNAIHEILRGRSIQPDIFSAWASAPETALDRAEELVRRGELRYPYPVTFGSHSEMIWSSARSLPSNPEKWINKLIGSGVEGELLAADVDEHLDHIWWYIAEFQSILVRVSAQMNSEDQVHDVTRAQMVEYITYRRAGLMAIQRETQQITAERLPVEGARVADWMWLMSALTNDYVLGGWSATMFERFKRKYRDFEGVRNLFGLESQVSSNIESFQGRLDAESSRMGVITGVLFGIVAATALVPLGELLVIWIFHLGKNSYANFPNNYPLAFFAIVTGMLGLIGFICWRLLRRARSLRPPTSIDDSRHFRLSGRVRALKLTRKL